MTEDERFLRRALDLAERGRGSVEPNPLVGALIVRDGQIVGEGWHIHFGGPHAEVVALAAAGDRARGSTLYVSLEPCCHQGKTPPCTEAVRRAGIARVVAAIADPFPQVAGGGFAALRELGIKVEVGMCAAQAAEQNAPYHTLIGERRPYVHAKWAMSLDGRLATRTGDSKWISGEESRRRVHELRGRMDAIIVGAGTVRADDPLLTARPPGPRVATRIVLSSTGRLPAGCRLRQTLDQAPVLVTTTSDEVSEAYPVLPLPSDRGRPSVAALLEELGRRRMTNVLVEGGAETLGSFVDARLVDEVHVFVAPRLLGGGQCMIGGHGATRIVDGLPLLRWDHRMSGYDLYVHGWVRPHGQRVQESDEPAE
jgi:diaminohydroxyphosphoribosylaminopyrimidine deaminase/5-amino-6-(5-phosphoribosylamino)uracil reductase